MTSLAVLSLWLLGRKRIIGWPIGLLAQPIALFYDIRTNQWGFVPSIFFFSYVQFRAWRTWVEESRG